MLRGRYSAVFVSLLILASARANAQDRNDIAQLREALHAQQKLNQKLLERIEALEAGHGAILAKIQSVEESIPDEDMLREERDSIVEEINQEYFDLQDKLDALPRFGGYLGQCLS